MTGFPLCVCAWMWEGGRRAVGGCAMWRLASPGCRLSVGANMAMEVSQHPSPRLAVVAVLISQCFLCCRACGWNWLQTTRRWNGGLVHGLEAPFWHLWLVDKLLYKNRFERGAVGVGLIDVQQFMKSASYHLKTRHLFTWKILYYVWFFLSGLKNTSFNIYSVLIKICLALLVAFHDSHFFLQ